MATKKAQNVSGETIVGFDPKETKLLAAAFVASVGPDKYDYELMATLTGNTAGTLKKMLPPVKRKATDAHASFAAFLGIAADGANGSEKKVAPKATKKRKATSEPDETDAANKALQPDGGKTDGKKAPAKPRPRAKKVNKKATPDVSGEDKNEVKQTKVEDSDEN